MQVTGTITGSDTRPDRTLSRSLSVFGMQVRSSPEGTGVEGCKQRVEEGAFVASHVRMCRSDEGTANEEELRRKQGGGPRRNPDLRNCSAFVMCTRVRAGSDGCHDRCRGTPMPLFCVWRRLPVPGTLFFRSRIFLSLSWNSFRHVCK